MTVQTRNEAAERLRTRYLLGEGMNRAALIDDVDAALAAERRATIERIRAALAAMHRNAQDNGLVGAERAIVQVFAILDKEAAR